jgi:hypothetical protein
VAETDHAIYFDTPDRVVKKAGFNLRIRHRLDDDSYVQTVKSAATAITSANRSEALAAKKLEGLGKTLRKFEREDPFWM